ncbi:MAG: hypothetical protein WBX00_12700 [Isosphaeraceae bacterium]
MVCLIVGIIAMSALASLPVCVLENAPASQKAEAKRCPRTITLTGEKYDQVVTVRDGDTLELSLPALLPMRWTLVQGQTILKEVQLQPDLTKVEKGEQNSGQTRPPNLTEGSRPRRRYQVVVKGKVPETLEWMYCMYDSLEKTKEILATHQAPPPDEFNPEKVKDPKDARLGMIFRVKLKLDPS